MLDKEVTPASLTREIALHGEHRQLGLMHGEACRDALHAFLDDQLARIHLLRPTPLARAELDSRIRAYWSHVQHSLPGLASELKGLAQGACIPIELACLLQFRRELIGYHKVPRLGDCSTIAARGAHPYVAQTVDLNGNMAPLGVVLRIDGRQTGTPNILMFTFKGLLGYLGMNDAGVCVGINVVLAGDWGPGVSPYLMVRRMLACRTVDECIGVIRGLPAASSRSFTILDQRRLVAVEFGAGRFEVLERDLSTHTNHFLHPDMAALDEINVLSRNGSRKRLAVLDRYASTYSSFEQVERLFELFSSHSVAHEGLCIHNGGDPRRDETVGAIVMLPKERRMLVRFGLPCEARTEEFCL